MCIHLAKFFGLLEAIRAAVRRILAFEIEISASLAGCISIAFDLSAFAFVAVKLKLVVKDMVAMRGFESDARNETTQQHLPSNRDVSIPLRARMCVPIRIRARIIVFPLLSAPSSCFRRTFRTLRLSLTIHAGVQCDGCDWGDGRLGEICQVGDLVFEDVHNHIEFVIANIEVREACLVGFWFCCAFWKSKLRGQ